MTNRYHNWKHMITKKVYLLGIARKGIGDVCYCDFNVINTLLSNSNML